VAYAEEREVCPVGLLSCRAAVQIAQEQAQAQKEEEARRQRDAVTRQALDKAVQAEREMKQQAARYEELMVSDSQLCLGGDVRREWADCSRLCRHAYVLTSWAVPQEAKSREAAAAAALQLAEERERRMALEQELVPARQLLFSDDEEEEQPQEQEQEQEEEQEQEQEQEQEEEEEDHGGFRLVTTICYSNNSDDEVRALFPWYPDTLPCKQHTVGTWRSLQGGVCVGS
jgi:hypothetical protein